MTAATYEQLVRQVHDLLATDERRERISVRRWTRVSVVVELHDTVVIERRSPAQSVVGALISTH